MNKQLEEFARTSIKDGLSELTEHHHNLFKRMYSPNDLTLSIDEIVYNMDVDELDWAMQQIQRTLRPVKTISE